MTTPGTLSTPSPKIDFKRNLPFRTGAAGIEITATRDPAVLSAIATDAAFPGSDDIGLGDISANAQAGRDVMFATPKGSVGFKAGATANIGLGMYVHPDKLLQSVSLDQHVGAHFALPVPDASQFYLLFDWGYDVNASGTGSVAMGAASVKFSADAELVQNYALIRRFEKKTDKGGTGALEAITETLDSFMLPTHVQSENDISALTWIYSLTEGDLKGSIGVTYGYDFNWVREARFAGLKGDVGLKIQVGLSANMGFTLGGRWSIIVSRDDAKQVVRVRVFKRPTKGFNAALNVGATVQPHEDVLPQSMDDLIASILGVYAPQLLKDLSALEGWATGNTPLSGVLANVSSDYMLQLIGTVYKQVTGSKTFNPDQEFVKARDMVLNFLETWDGLDAKVASLVWSYLPGKDRRGTTDPAAAKIFKDVTDVVTAVSKADRAQFDVLLNQLGISKFFGSEAGQLVQALAGDTIFAALTSNDVFANLQKAAAQALPFLQATQSEQNILQALHDWIDSRVKISQIADAIEKNTADVSDGWLHAKIADFLEQRVFGLEELKKLDKLLTTLHGQANDYYAKAIKALNAKYSVSLAATYESTSTITALLDAEFDFGNPAASRQELQRLMGEAVHGDITGLLMKDTPGVTLHSGSLSHGIERHSHIELRLPFYASTVDHINSSLAAASSVEAEGQRMLVYQLDSRDEVTRITNRGGNDSHLVLGAKITPEQGNATRVFGTPIFNYSYSYRQASRNVGREQLQYQMKPYVDEYLREQFSAMPFDSWLTEMDRAVSHAPANNFAYALASLDVRVRSSVVEAWLRAPGKDRAPEYLEMSVALQAALRTVIPFYYFADAQNYSTLGSAYPLIAYSAMPVSTSASLDGNQLRLNTGRSVYWDWMDQDLRRAMLSAGRSKLRAMLPAVFQRLQSARIREAEFYEPGDGTAERIISAVVRDDHLLKSLLFTEAEIIDGAIQAGLKLEKFVSGSGADVQQATRALAAFGSTITETFNKKITSVYGGDALRPLGTMLFVTAANALVDVQSPPDAMFRFLVMDPQSQFNPTDFLAGKEPQKDVLIQQTVTTPIR